MIPVDDIPGPIVVTGACGFIGSNLVRRLVKLGRTDVSAIVNPSVDMAEFGRHLPRGVKVRQFDLTNTRAMFLPDSGTVFHLAADMGGVGWFHSDKDFGSATRNAIISNNVLAHAAERGVDRLVYTSSACTYPTEIQQQPGVAPSLAEDQRYDGTPDARYGFEKRSTMWMCERAPFDARVAILHTVYGPLQEHEGQRMKFPAAVATKALKARDTGALELWGDGRQLRSYLYVDDAVDRLIRIAAHPENVGPVNVGKAGAVTCYDVARMCLDIAGVPDAEIRTVPGPVGVWGRDCDNTKWGSIFGPTNDVSDREGFTRFMAWLDAIL